MTRSPGPAVAGAQPFRLTPPEVLCLDAILDLLIPADDTWPGARAAGVLGFIERQLEGPYGAASRWYVSVTAADQGQIPTRPRDLYRLGLAQMDRIAQAEMGCTFASMESGRAADLLSRAERGGLDTHEAPVRAFFELVLENTMEGFFADPVHGGNHGAASWRMVGFPGCGHDYSKVIVSHRNRSVDVPLQSIQSLRASGNPG